MMRECVEFGCPVLVPRNRTRCDAHESKHRAAEEAGRADAEPWRPFYRSRRWARTRSRVLIRDGNRCTRILPRTGRRCGKAHRLQVHHRRKPSDVYREVLDLGGTQGEALAAVESMFFDERLLATVCGTCHPEVEREHDDERGAA
jgi:hypothetical protein